MPPSISDTVDKILAREGGFVNNPDDKGGPTNHGITQRTLSSFLHRPATIEDVQNLSIDTAKGIMMDSYYYAPRINALPAGLQPEMFDMCYNHGSGNAIRMLQRVINNSGWGPVKLDGALGAMTSYAAEKCYAAMGDEMINELVAIREAFYQSIVNRDPSQEQFIDGWMKRAESYKV